MSEIAPEQAEATAPHEQPQAGEAETKTFDADYVSKLRAENAKWRTEAKANAGAAEKLRTIEQQNMSELDRAKSLLEQATKRASDLELDNLRKEVGLSKGLSKSMVDRLRGATEDELAADADQLLEELKAFGGMTPDRSQGNGSAAAATPEQQFMAFAKNL